MTTSRRSFIKKGTITLAGATLLSRVSIASLNAKQVTGLQLYSVRDEMKADPLGTLRQVAAMGYKYVEHAGYTDRRFYGSTATEFKKILDDLGLKMISGHTVMGK